jgi:hypothetical protein
LVFDVRAENAIHAQILDGGDLKGVFGPTHPANPTR